MNTNFQTVLTFLEENNAPQNVLDALGALALAPAPMKEEPETDPNKPVCPACGGRGCDYCDPVGS